ncbi:FitA-like ribbon-helix-helix domain-containing protein [Paracoccus sanguinis]|nr:hypothetical protein [Paracoccus sanguinis]
MQIDSPSTSLSKICHALGRGSAARTSFSVSLSLFRNALHSVFRSDTGVETPAYQRDDSQTGRQARTGAGRAQPAPVGWKRGIFGTDDVDCTAIAAYSITGGNRSRRMASITIRNLDDDIKRRLRVRAAEHGRSMEEEAREILREMVGDSRPPLNLAHSLRARVAKIGGVDLDIPARDAMRNPPVFDQ